ncbi:hypothetical protein, partial [Rikenella microfusus]
FVSFFGRAKKEMPRRHEASGETGAPRQERAKKNKRPSAKGSTFNRTFNLLIQSPEPARAKRALRVAALRRGWLRADRYADN